MGEVPASAHRLPQTIGSDGRPHADRGAAREDFLMCRTLGAQPVLMWEVEEAMQLRERFDLSWREVAPIVGRDHSALWRAAKRARVIHTVRGNTKKSQDIHTCRGIA